MAFKAIVVIATTCRFMDGKHHSDVALTAR